METTGPQTPEQHSLHLLGEICATLDLATPHDQQLAHILNAVNALVGVRDSWILLPDEPTGGLAVHVATGPKRPDFRRLKLPKGAGLAGWVMAQGQPLLVDDVTRDPRFDPRITQHFRFAPSSALCLPIRSGATVIGVLEMVARPDGRALTTQDIPLVAVFVELIRLVLEQVRYRATAEHAQSDLEQMVQAKTDEIDLASKNVTLKTQRFALTTKIIALINSNQSIPEILVGVAEYLRKLIPFDYATVALLQDTNQVISLVEIYPQPPQTLNEGVRVTFDDPVITYVVHYKRALFHNRLRWYRCFLEHGRFLEQQLGTMFCTPILTADMVLGTLNLGVLEASQYAQETIDIVTFVAKQLGIAFERHKLRHDLEEMNQQLNAKTFELRKSIITMGDANLKLFDMQQQLRDKDKAMQSLLQEVQTKNEELNTTLRELQQTQTHLVQSEKMASLGQLVAGISHELNTPAGAIKAASEIIPDHLQKIFAAYEKLFEANLSPAHRHQLHELARIMLKAVKETARRTTSEIREEGKALVQQLKERGVKNPRAVAKDIARCTLECHLDALFELFEHYGVEPVMDFLNHCHRLVVSARDNQLSIEAISKIIRALKSYSYLDQSQERNVDLNEDLENTITILHSHIPANVAIIRQFGALPKITCLGSELNQVWTNLLQNALQATEEHGGTITIATAADDRDIIVKIIDTGVGIPSEIKEKIFDPFFTTRRGKNRGLGLSITQQVVARHHGAIHVASADGQTCFEIRLPREGVSATE